MRKLISLFLFLTALPAGWLNAAAPIQRLQAIEAEISEYHHKMSTAGDEAVRLLYHDSIRYAFQEALSIPESFDYPFDGLKQMAVLTSDDRLFRVVNWNMPKDNGTHLYGAFFMWKEEKRRETSLHWVELTQVPDDNVGYANKYMSPEQWKGALYYEVITVTHKKDTYYLLLGWDGANAIINRKIIEPVALRGDKVRLGAPVFVVDKGSPKRFIMEYSEEVSASLKYRKAENRIVFDHLAPRAQGLEGNPAFYGPDLTFDAFVYDKGKWVFEPNVEVTLGREESQRPYIDPRRTR